MRDEPSTPLNIYNRALLRIFFPISTATDSKRDQPLPPPPPPPPLRFVSPPFKRIALSRRFTGFQYSPINPAALLDQLMKNKDQVEERGKERERERERRKEGKRKEETGERKSFVRCSWCLVHEKEASKAPFSAGLNPGVLINPAHLPVNALANNPPHEFVPIDRNCSDKEYHPL